VRGQQACGCGAAARRRICTAARFAMAWGARISTRGAAAPHHSCSRPLAYAPVVVEGGRATKGVGGGAISAERARAQPLRRRARGRPRPARAGPKPRGDCTSWLSRLTVDDGLVPEDGEGGVGHEAGQEAGAAQRRDDVLLRARGVGGWVGQWTFSVQRRGQERGQQRGVQRVAKSGFGRCRAKKPRGAGRARTLPVKLVITQDALFSRLALLASSWDMAMRTRPLTAGGKEAGVRRGSGGPGRAGARRAVLHAMGREWVALLAGLSTPPVPRHALWLATSLPRAARRPCKGTAAARRGGEARDPAGGPVVWPAHTGAPFPSRLGRLTPPQWRCVACVPPWRTSASCALPWPRHSGPYADMQRPMAWRAARRGQGREGMGRVVSLGRGQGGSPPVPGRAAPNPPPVPRPRRSRPSRCPSGVCR
jgi:hypothetical protein